MPPQQRLVLYRSTYISALHEHLRRPSEGSLTVAYELGRAAVRQQLSVLDVAVAYHQGLNEALSDAGQPSAPDTITRCAGEFFLESLASYEMLQLAVDQGRELLAADCCLATVAAPGVPRAAEAVSHPEPDSEWTFTRWLDLAAIYRLLEDNEGRLRLTREDEALSALLTGRSSDRSIDRWLAVSLTALDGTQIGALQAFDQHPGSFGEEDEAALVHLAQMVSATVERMRLYRQAASMPG